MSSNNYKIIYYLQYNCGDWRPAFLMNSIKVDWRLQYGMNKQWKMGIYKKERDWLNVDRKLAIGASVHLRPQTTETGRCGTQATRAVWNQQHRRWSLKAGQQWTL